MPSPSLSELNRVLSIIESLQQQLTDLFATKITLLRDAQGDELHRLAAQEETLVHRLRQALDERRQMLDRARRGGLDVQTLTELAAALGGDPALQTRLDQAQLRALHLQQESWVHWIIAHRCYSHYTEVLDLIAHGGEAAPAYTRFANRTSAANTPGGAVLDASI